MSTYYPEPPGLGVFPPPPPTAPSCKEFLKCNKDIFMEY